MFSFTHSFNLIESSIYSTFVPNLAYLILNQQPIIPYYLLLLILLIFLIDNMNMFYFHQYQIMHQIIINLVKVLNQDHHPIMLIKIP